MGFLSMAKLGNFPEIPDIKSFCFGIMVGKSSLRRTLSCKGKAGPKVHRPQKVQGMQMKFVRFRFMSTNQIKYTIFAIIIAVIDRMWSELTCYGCGKNAFDNTSRGTFNPIQWNFVFNVIMQIRFMTNSA